MSDFARFRRAATLALPALLFLTLPFVAGCGGGGSSGTPGDSDVMVTYFSMSGRTDVYRNQLLEVRFTAPVAPGSVSNRTFRMLTGPTLSTPHNGAAIVDGNRIYFDPTRTQAVYDREGPAARPDMPFGFEGSTQFQIFLPGPPEENTLTNLSGDPIVASFTDGFTTSDEYVPELEQPRYIGPDGDGGGVGFEPPSTWDPNYTHPALSQPGANVVAYDAWCFLQFDEAILPGTMDPGITVKVENTDVTDSLGRPFTVPGTLEPSGDGSLYVFRPTFGFGSGPYRIRITLTQQITDLAGNPLLNAPLSIYFFTEFKPGVTTPGSLIETFDNRDFVDAPNTTADWDQTYSGELRSGPITTRVVTIDPQGDGVNSRETLTDYPLVRPDQAPGCNVWPNGTRVQQSYTTSDLGTGPGTITELTWGPNSNALFIATHNNIQITLGHVADPNGDGNPKAELTPTFKNNFDGGMPSPHYSGRYDIPQRLNIDPPGLDTGFWPYPKSVRPFEYNGTRGLVVDYNMDAGSDCQTVRGWNWGVPGAANAPGVRNIVATSKDATNDNFSGLPAGTGQMYVLDSRITIRRQRTVAQSLFYDTNVAEPIYSAPVVSPPVQPNAAQYTLEVQGATDPSDPSTYTAWTEDLTELNDPKTGGPRFIRFRFTLYADLDTDTLARIDQVTVAFEF